MSESRTFAWPGKCESCSPLRFWSCAALQPTHHSWCTAEGRALRRSYPHRTRRKVPHDSRRNCLQTARRHTAWNEKKTGLWCTWSTLSTDEGRRDTVIFCPNTNKYGNKIHEPSVKTDIVDSGSQSSVEFELSSLQRCFNIVIVHVFNKHYGGGFMYVCVIFFFFFIHHWLNQTHLFLTPEASV